MAPHDNEHGKYAQFASLRTCGVAAEHFPLLEANRRIHQHGHAFVEIMILVRGTCMHGVGQHWFRSEPGDVAIIHDDMEHCIIPGDEGAEVYNIYIDTTFLGHIGLPPDCAAYEAALLPLRTTGHSVRARLTRLHCADFEPVLAIVRLLALESAGHGAGRDEAVRSLFRLFAIHCARCAQADGFRPLPVWAEWADMERVRQRLETAWMEDDTLADLAAVAQVSRGHLCRRFRAYTGESPFGYRLRVRMQAAMQQLRLGTDKVVAVAYACGFRDLAFFNRKFRAFTGVSPRAWRRQMQATKPPPP